MPLPSLFNPSNDMALASGLWQYSPPKRIQQMEADLAGLATLWDGTQFQGPWGWSLATKRRYRQMGVTETELPTEEWLAEVRRLSSREFACGYIQKLLQTFQDERLLGREMAFHTSLPTIGEENDSTAYPLIFKSPWSSSGRGVFTSVNLTAAQIRTRLQGFLHTQGGYASDRFHDGKMLDFAMEFFVDEHHRVDFLGYSVFQTEANGTYGHNLVDSQERLRSLIGFDADLLDRLVDYHKHHLGQTAYHGPVGIDMLLATAPSENRLRLHPVVEINFRMNMGILALLLYQQYGSNATVQLTPSRMHGFEAVVKDGKLKIMYNL